MLAATWTTIRSRDSDELAPLVRALPQIRRATEELELGGALHSNSANLDAALTKLENVRDGACWCASYPTSQFFEPAKEERAGYVRILSTSTPGWSMTYECLCTVCEQVFGGEQGDYHYMWWRWAPREATSPPG